MAPVAEKLVALALSTENVDEACAALRKARRVHPKGKLNVWMGPDLADLRRARLSAQTEREALAQERRALAETIAEHKRVIEEKEAKQRSYAKWHGLGDYAVVLSQTG